MNKKKYLKGYKIICFQFKNKNKNKKYSIFHRTKGLDGWYWWKDPCREDRRCEIQSCMSLPSSNNPSVVGTKGLLCPCAFLVIFYSNSLITQQILLTASSDEEGSGSLHRHMRCSSSISRPTSKPSQEACSWPWSYRPCCPMDSASRLHAARMPLKSANLPVWLTCLCGLWSLVLLCKCLPATLKIQLERRTLAPDLSILT